MPSEPSDGRPERPRGVAARWATFEMWRKMMIAGALVLLGDALLRAVLEGSWPDWAGITLTIFGYVLLALGFARRMRDRREASEAKRQRERLKG